MKLLADAHISRAAVAHLRGLGHDVVHAATFPPRASDSFILKQASRDGRIVLTADKDFGELCFLRLMPCSGVILLRLTASSEPARTEIFKRAWPVVEQTAAGHFVVVTDTAVRRSPLPSAEQ
jgi:predicted nuclease of predicted toxin-antitoxin system